MQRGWEVLLADGEEHIKPDMEHVMDIVAIRTCVQLERVAIGMQRQAALAAVESPVALSTRAKARVMKACLAPPAKHVPLSPTRRFMNAHWIGGINHVLSSFGMNNRDLSLFKRMIAEEKQGFLGYQAGSSTVRLFQDMLGMVVKYVLEIPIKEDFVFTRVPGDATFHYETADEFLADLPKLGRDDQEAAVRQHILSLNMNLYQSYDKSWDLTPRYYLENTTWTYANVREIIKPFFASLGVGSLEVDRLWSRALDLLPHDRGYILQLFDESNNYEFVRKHSYIAYSGGKPIPYYKNHEILFDETASDFPQMRLVMSNESTLNPFSPLSMKRYDNLTFAERQKYENGLRSLLEQLCFSPEKVSAMREKLLQEWGVLAPMEERENKPAPATL